MSVEIASEIWKQIKGYINVVDRNEAAEIVVNVLIENDIDAEEIKNSFKGDSDVKRALADHLNEDESIEDEDEDIDDDDNDY